MLYQNAIQITGNLGQDAETTTTKGNRTVTRFSIANTKRYTRDGKRFEKTQWVRIAAWGSIGKYAAQLKKGEPVLIQGELNLSEFVGDDKVKRQTHEIVARNIIKIDHSKAPAGENPDADSDPDEE